VRHRAERFGANLEHNSLWSLGHGDEARGYGKTRHLLWFAGRVNEDFGRSAGTLARGGRHAETLLAAYAAFSTVEGRSLSNLLFDVALNLARSQGGTLAALRAAAFDTGRTPSDMMTDSLDRVPAGILAMAQGAIWAGDAANFCDLSQ
jgi:hypothetical protein